jgi:hypothetical protein
LREFRNRQLASSEGIGPVRSLLERSRETRKGSQSQSAGGIALEMLLLERSSEVTERQYWRDEGMDPVSDIDGRLRVITRFSCEFQQETPIKEQTNPMVVLVKTHVERRPSGSPSESRTPLRHFTSSSPTSAPEAAALRERRRRRRRWRSDRRMVVGQVVDGLTGSERELRRKREEVGFDLRRGMVKEEKKN